MFLFNLFFRLSREKQLAFYSPNLKQPTDSAISPSINHNFCYGPVRDFRVERCHFESNISTHRIFQVRDPRDILVSQYYSFGWNHTDQGFNKKEEATREKIRNQTIDEYVLEPLGAAHYLNMRFQPLIKFLNQQKDETKFSVVTYEEMVTDFPGYLAKVIQPFELNRYGFRSRSVVQAKYQFKYRNEFRPEQKHNAHKRNVMPGEHRDKLKPQTIAALNDYFAECLTRLGYEPDAKIKAA